MSKPTLTAKVTAARLDDDQEGVVITLMVQTDDNAADFEVTVPADYSPPAVGDEVELSWPCRKRKV